MANFGIVPVLFLLVSCATSPEVPLSPTKTIQPVSAYQYKKDIFELAFFADNQILIIPQIAKGQTSTEPEILNVQLKKLDDVETPTEFQTATAFLGRPDGGPSYFIYKSENRSILAHYEPGQGKTYGIRTDDLGDRESVLEHGFKYISVPGRDLLFFAPSFSNTIFEKSGEDPVKIAILQQDLVVRDLAYNSKTNELFAISSIDNLLIRFSAAKTGLQKKDQLRLDVRRGQNVFIDEKNGNIMVLDNFANKFEVIRTDPSLKSVGIYPMPENDGSYYKTFEKRPLKTKFRSSTAHHFQSLEAMVVITDGALTIFDTKNFGQTPFRLEGAYNVRRLAVSSDQRYLLLLSNRGGLLLYDLSTLF